jgi:hypothetical protein
MRRRGAASRGAGISGLVTAFQSGAAALQNRLAELRAETAVIERALASVGANGEPVRRGPGRPRKIVSMDMPTVPAPRMAGRSGKGRRAKGQDLASMMVNAMKSSRKPMRVAEIAAAVTKAGYSSSSPAFKKIVAMRLLDRKKFKRAGRGLYSAAK